MMGIKGGTQTWNNAQQTSSLKGDNTLSVSSADQEKYFSGESLGDTLNKVADPNYIDDSKKMRTVGDNQLGKDAFMTLLLTQMKNQDPTNPLKSHEMAAQLAQFTQLEKLQGINDGIEGLRKDAQPNTNFQALSFIGKTISTDNSKVSRTDTESQHDIRFSIPQDAAQVKLVVKDAAGNPVRNLEFKSLKSGKNELNWNGLTDDGSKAPVGEYVVALEAVGNNGRKMFVETKTEGVISGVNFTPKGPQLMVGKQVINMADVKSISDSSVQPQLDTPRQPNFMPFPGAANSALSEGPKKAEVKPETKPDAQKRAKLSKGDLNDAAMAQGLINQLNKTGAKAGMG